MEFLNHLVPAATVREALWGTLVRIYSAWLAEQNDVPVRTFSGSTNRSGTTQDLGPDDDSFDAALAEAYRKIDACKVKRDQA